MCLDIVAAQFRAGTDQCVTYTRYVENDTETFCRLRLSNDMKTFGYAKQKVGSRGLLEMREVTFTGSAASIREIGQFLLAAAEEMENNGPQFDHLHIADRSSGWLKKWPDIVVSRGGK